MSYSTKNGMLPGERCSYCQIEAYNHTFVYDDDGVIVAGIWNEAKQQIDICEPYDHEAELEQELAQERERGRVLEHDEPYLSEVVKCAIAVDNERWYPTLPTIQINIAKLQALHDAIVKLGIREAWKQAQQSQPTQSAGSGKQSDQDRSGEE